MGLQPLPETFVATRKALHRVAEEVVAPARKPENEIALTATPGGFGTPTFEFEGRSLQVTVDGADLVVIEDGAERREAITSIARAAAFAGEGLFPGGVPDESEPLRIDEGAARALCDFYVFAAPVLETVLEGLPEGDEPSTINLWPEHFDVAYDAGSEALGRRANYGASPGDAEHPEPYLYVGPWRERPRDEVFNATAFAGAELPYADLVAAEDPAQLACEFFRGRREALER